MGQAITTTQFFLHGRKRFTQTGWIKAQQSYRPGAFLAEADLDALVCNAGALLDQLTLTTEGHEVTFASACRAGGRHGCAPADPWRPLRSPGLRLLSAFAAADAAAARLGRPAPHPGLQWRDVQHQVARRACSAPCCSPGLTGRRRPGWAVGTATAKAGFKVCPALASRRGSALTAGCQFDGQLAYAYAKRGQVLLAEQWAAMNPEVKVVSCHPGWVDTPGVESAYGSKKKCGAAGASQFPLLTARRGRYLEPMRTPWQGAEGIAWCERVAHRQEAAQASLTCAPPLRLAVAPGSEIESGAFYLDRSAQVKHLAGPFMSEGSRTKNSPAEVAELMAGLERLAA